MREARAQLFNVLTLGVGFCLVFTGFNTVSQTQVPSPRLRPVTNWPCVARRWCTARQPT